MRSNFVPTVALSLCALTLSAAPSQASVLTFTSDSAFNTYAGAGNFTKQWGANVRWGNAAGNGDWERAIVNASDVPIGSPAQNAWTSSNVHDVTLTYDASLGTATLDLGGIGSITRSVPTMPEVFFARVRDSVSAFSELKDIEVDLAFNGVGIDYTYDELLGDANAEYWGVSDPNLRFGFTIVAKALLAGPVSAGSDPMYQFKVGVPAPGAGAAIALAGLASLRRRR